MMSPQYDSQVYHKNNFIFNNARFFNGIWIMRHIFYTDFRKFLEKKATSGIFPLSLGRNPYQKHFSFIPFIIGDVTYQ